MEDDEVSKLSEFSEKRKLFVNSEAINKKRRKEANSAIDLLKTSYEKEVTRAEAAEKAYEDLHKNISRYSNEFQVTEELGSGSYGTVFQCTRKFDKCDYAIKRIRFVGSSAILMTEVYALAKLKHEGIIRYYNSWIEVDDITSDMNIPIIPYHKNQVKVGDEDEDEDGYIAEDQIFYFKMDESETQEPVYLSLFIQMELCKMSLNSAFLRRDIIIDYDKGLDYFRQIVEAVSYMHEQGVVHKDLGSTNIFLDFSSKIKIADFGIARVGDVDLHQSSPGLQLYSAPERKDKVAEIDAKADIYSLGILLFELISRLSSAHERAKLLKDLTEERVFPNEMKAGDKDYILRLLSVEPTDRPSAKEILEWLRQ